MARRKSVENMTRGERVIAFIEEYCKVPEGRHVGKPIKLAPFQKKFILETYDNPSTTRRAILSIARKNGKTALIACLLLAHICGPEAVLNSQIVSGALSREQAALVFHLAEKMIGLSEELQAVTRIIPSGKKIVGMMRNVEFKALAADGPRIHGISPVLAILDELGQVKGARSAFVEAITTSQGAHAAPLLLVISTQAASDADLLSLWIDDTLRGSDPTQIVHLYAAPADKPLRDPAGMKAANPGLGHFREPADLRLQLEEAERVPALEAHRRNLLLNQRVALESLWLGPAAWKACGAAPDLRAFRENPVAVALDLSARNDLTAAVFAARDEDGFVHLLPYVFTPSRGIDERARIDRADYVAWAAGGFLHALPGASVDYETAATFLRDECERLDITPDVVAFDRWRIDVFKKAAETSGFAQEATWIEVGQGFKDISPRVDAFETLLLAGRIRHGAHPLLTMGASNAIAVRDPAGNRKLDKAKSTQRIDPLVAAVMAAFEVTEGAANAVDVSAWVA